MLEIKDWHKRFGDNEVLRGVNLSVGSGEVLSIIGASGSGKSTLLRTLNFLEMPDSGTLIFDDIDLNVDVAKITKEEVLKVRRNTAMVFQSYNLFKHKTALENVMESLVIVQKMDKKQAQEVAEAHLEQVGLADRMGYYPSELSGGQQQRVGIARALAIHPKIILFDEPTSALDPEMVGGVLEVIKSIADEGMALIIVTHEMQFARDISDNVIFFDEGNILEEDAPEVFFTNPKQERTKQFLQRMMSNQ